ECQLSENYVGQVRSVGAILIPQCAGIWGAGACAPAESRGSISLSKGEIMSRGNCFSVAAIAAVLAIVQAFLIQPPAHTQTVSTGAVAGVVTDPSGAAIAGAVVTATEKGTGFKRSATTDTSGSYRFSLLPP